jgi:2,4-dienoyl-CoA reductase (NADPH2)
VISVDSVPAQTPSIFDPVRLGPVTAKNRIFYSPASVGYAIDGEISDMSVEHYGRRALGGAGAVMTEHFAISDEGRQHYRQPAAWPDPRFRPGLERLAREIRSHGALPIAQISHAGRYAGPWDEWSRRPRLAPSAVAFPLLGQTLVPQEMTRDDIDRVVADFAAATRFLLDAGFGGVEIHGMSGFLVSEFLSPRMNMRTDEYGGDVAARARFAVEVVRACRDAAGDNGAVGMHVMTDELIDGGVQISDLAIVIPVLEEAGAQFFRPGAGSFETLRMPENAPRSAHHDANGPDTAALRAAATVPILANGGLSTREDAEGALAKGASAVALARPILADPDWMAKVTAGQDEQIVHCPCDPAMCLRTQLTGAICASWPEQVQQHGFSVYDHHAND